MKKILLTLSLLVFTACSNPAAAQSLKVSSMQDFTTETPAQTLKVMTLEQATLKNGTVLPEGAIIKGEIFDVRPPMRGKLNATFKFKPLTYSYNGQIVQINDEEIVAKYAPYKELDKAELATSAVSTAGSFILKIPGFGEAVSFAKGAVKDPEDNRLKSGVKQIYKDSFFSYVEEGKEVILKKDEMFILKFKVKGEKDEETAQEAEQNVSTQVPTAPVQTQEQNAVQKEPAPIQPVDPYDVLKEVENNKNN